MHRMLAVRPTPTTRYVERPRLLSRLPDSPGFVVWLEAPYGYGKSVVTMQWAEHLETDGWRVLWFSLAGREPLAALQGALGLPSEAPWGTVLEQLWSERTLLVLEDLDGDEELEPLLKGVAGVLALSSRKPLGFPGLPPLLTSGRLVHLQASDLAFTEAEALALLPDADDARRVWRETAGWALPLHFASLTGSAPDPRALLQGVRNSVSTDAWREALLVATLDVLPTGAATAATRELASAGFVQVLDGGYRVHPLAAEIVLEYHGDEARAVVAEEGPRLPPALQGRAYQRVGHRAGLRDLLDDPDDETYRVNPGEFLRWHANAGEPVSVVRRAHVAVAHMIETFTDREGRDVEAGLSEAALLASDESHPARWRARVALAALFVLGAEGRFEEAQPFREVAERLAPELPPFEASRVSRTLVTYCYHAGDYEAMEQHIAAAREELARGADDPRQPEAVTIHEQSVAIIRFERSGDTMSGRAALTAVLDAAAAQGAAKANAISPPVLAKTALELATLHAVSGHRDEALGVLVRWSHLAEGGLGVRMALQAAMLGCDPSPFDELFAQAQRVSEPLLVDAAAAGWLRYLRHRNETQRALELRPVLPEGPYCSLELALLDHALGNEGAADAALTASENALPARGFRLYWLEAAYLVRRDPALLEALCDLLDVGPAALRGLDIPLSALPRDRPALAHWYPLEEVMSSGWSEAVASREPELPHLRLWLLGGVRAQLFGTELPFSDRQRQLLALLALGFGREAIGAAMWPEAEPGKVRNNLNVLLNGLRKLIQPWGLPTYLHEGGLRRFASDLEQVEDALAGGDWDSVARLYAGRLGEGLDLGPVSAQADVLESRVLEGLRQAAAEAEPERAIWLLDRLLELDPLHEEALHDLVELLLRSGRRREARRRYRALADRLRSELGVEASDSTRQLIEGS